MTFFTEINLTDVKLYMYAVFTHYVPCHIVNCILNYSHEKKIITKCNNKSCKLLAKRYWYWHWQYIYTAVSVLASAILFSPSIIISIANSFHKYC